MAIYLLQTLRRSKSTVYRIKNRLLLSSTPRKMSSGLPLQEVVNTLESYASSLLAESWDNVGLLVEPSAPMFVKKLFLTNDLTEGVLTEAVMKSADMVLSYHPPLFVPFKRIVQQKWKDRIIVKALENRIAIYSPHTSYDAVKGDFHPFRVGLIRYYSELLMVLKILILREFYYQRPKRFLGPQKRLFFATIFSLKFTTFLSETRD